MPAVIWHRAGSFAAWLWTWQMPWFYQGSWPSETLSGSPNLCLSLKSWRGEKLLFTPMSSMGGELKQKDFTQVLSWPKLVLGL